ncbi:hypothetical protein Arub01_37670 [Actinomadura rubrobrunea]|uniref:Coenzyme Q-binding protein COQ10 START domain-containing protein n=1 Tax=Actinomadura rubrobrunea TaxID=115335 RepID=A0A9W6UWX8_9ACTN|nr:SRPBCC family protein [Actinomadura rubrobrunea]GLW65523.1 hypothetical protein Arub01_37670 [Actinomadura rubrobrunea]
MKFAKATTGAALWQLAKRVGGKKQSPVDRVTDALTGGGKFPLPVNRTTATAGGALLGLGAAIAAARAASRLSRRAPAQETSASGSGAPSTAETEKAAGSAPEKARGGKESGGTERKPSAGGLKRLFGKAPERAEGAGRGGRGGGKKIKVTNIVEHIDIGAPRRMVYDQWTQFEDFPSFMKKVHSVNQESDEKLTWTAQIFWSTRSWESTITQQIPDERIAWQSKGAKGHVDGSVTFHELAPDLTRVLVSLEYHPKGFFEKTANLWRAQGRRVRLELKHFRRHLINHVLSHPEELEGWRGEIRDSEVVKSHEDALAAEGKTPRRAKKHEEHAEERAKEKEYEQV